MRIQILFLGDYWSRAPSRATSVPPSAYSPSLRGLSVPPRDVRATSVPRFDPLSPLDLLSEYERQPFERGLSPTPIKCGRWAPRSSEVAFDTDGNLIFDHHHQHIFFSLTHFLSAIGNRLLLKQLPHSRERISKEVFAIFVSFINSSFWLLQSLRIHLCIFVLIQL